ADYKESATLQNDGINPWDTSTLNDLLKKINPLIVKFDGYRSSTKPYTGKVALSTLKNASRNKVIEIGKNRIHIGMRGILRLCGFETAWWKEGLSGLMGTTYTNKMHLLFGGSLEKNSIVKRA
ncbi:checkpoint serine/threonine-protein kinase bub1-like protein, partial [Trifolium pratense]